MVTVNPTTAANQAVQAMIQRAQRAGNKGQVQELTRRRPELVREHLLRAKRDKALEILNRKV